MLTIYPACFYEEDNGYSVIFPDLNNLATCGSTLDEAMAMAVDCLAGYMTLLWEDQEEVPAPSPLAAISLDEEDPANGFTYKNAFVNLVSVDVKAYAKEHFEKSVKKTLSIPAWLNKAALEQGINFSKTLQEALIAKLHTA